ncbi:MAG: hypothetical protein ACJAQT_000512 [Akkermansiaceae bacterium]|jgi:hypothetical protein
MKVLVSTLSLSFQPPLEESRFVDMKKYLSKYLTSHPNPYSFPQLKPQAVNEQIISIKTTTQSIAPGTGGCAYRAEGMPSMFQLVHRRV